MRLDKELRSSVAKSMTQRTTLREPQLTKSQKILIRKKQLTQKNGDLALMLSDHRPSVIWEGLRRRQREKPGSQASTSSRITEIDHNKLFETRWKISSYFHENPPTRKDFLVQKEKRQLFYAEGPRSNFCVSSEENFNKKFKTIYPLVSPEVLHTFMKENAPEGRFLQRLVVDRKHAHGSSPVYQCKLILRKPGSLQLARLKAAIKRMIDRSRLLGVSMRFFADLSLSEPGKYTSKQRRFLKLIETRKFVEASLLLQIEPFLIYRPLPSGKSLLHWLVNAKDHRGLRFLLAHCRDADLQDSSGSTALDLALVTHDHESAFILLRSGADPLRATGRFSISSQNSPKRFEEGSIDGVLRVALRMSVLARILWMMMREPKKSRAKGEFQRFLDDTYFNPITLYSHPKKESETEQSRLESLVQETT